jgi:hypothetical protein
MNGEFVQMMGLVINEVNDEGKLKKPQPLGPEHPLGILMTLAAKGEWRNPSLSSPEHERVSKAFQRLQNLLRALVPLPGKPPYSNFGMLKKNPFILGFGGFIIRARR